MELFNKNENWRLRLTIVLITLGSLSTLSYYNRQMMDVKSLSDSLAYYKSLNDTLSIELENVRDETEFTRNTNGRIEMGVYDYVDDSSHAQMKADMDFVSKFTKEQRLKAINRIKTLRILNDYELCSWILAFELYRKEEPKISEEIERFINHLTE